MTGFRTGAPAPEAARYTGPGRFYSGSPGRNAGKGARPAAAPYAVNLLNRRDAHEMPEMRGGDAREGGVPRARGHKPRHAYKACAGTGVFLPQPRVRKLRQAGVRKRARGAAGGPGRRRGRGLSRAASPDAGAKYGGAARRPGKSAWPRRGTLYAGKTTRFRKRRALPEESRGGGGGKAPRRKTARAARLCAPARNRGKEETEWQSWISPIREA